MITKTKKPKKRKLALPPLPDAKAIAPLDSPGLPLPGPNFLEMAKLLGDTETEIVEGSKQADRRLASTGNVLEEVVRRAVYSRGEFSVRMLRRPGKYANLRVVSGHRWGTDVTGPRRTECMIIGKMLGKEEVAARRVLFGESGQLLYEAAMEFEETARIDGWYVTNLLKTGHPDGYGNSALKQAWIKEWLPVLYQELRIVRPKYILCLGADASKAVLGRDASVGHMKGRVKELKIPIGVKTKSVTTIGKDGEEISEEEEEIIYHTALVMTITHPAAVLSAPELEDGFRTDVARWVQLTRGQRWDKEEEGLEHRVVDDIEGMRALVQEIEADIQDNLLGLDAEWHGQHPQNKGAYLRSVQLSWRHKTAAAIKLRDEKGKPVFNKRELREVQQLWRRVTEGRQLAGHFFDADMEFLDHFGFKISDRYVVPATWQEYMLAALGGRACAIDTGYAAHALNETDDFSLTHQALRYTTAPRYDIKLDAWKKAYLKEVKMTAAELEGYGPCPDAILFGVHKTNGHHKDNYAAYDADVARRLAVRRMRQLCKDWFGNNCWEAYWLDMRAMPAVLEINTKGVLLDRARVDQLTQTYMTARDDLLQRVRDWSRWDDLNLNSHFQVREFLFGESLNGKSTKEETVRLRPEGARTLRLTPIITTDKRPMPWPEVVKQGLIDEKTASTNKTALAILARESLAITRWNKRLQERRTYDFSDQVNMVRDYRFISQVLKSSLRPPLLEKDEDSEEEVYRKQVIDGEAYWVYGGGIPAAVCDDGRIRTHIYPTKETGRWSSARPPLQNLSKRRESDYKRILGKSYSHKLRSIVMAPDGRVLVEADFVGAELFAMAIMSGDVKMIEHASRNQLPEDHADFYDIHSNVAVLAFNLKCLPTKAGLKSIDKIQLRVAAKNVIFGVAYGRGAKAIALQAKEEGNPITVDQAQQIIDTVFAIYPRLKPFFESCANRAIRQRWMCGPFGRFRRFPVARDRMTQGEFERQAQNFPIQNMVADVVDLAVANLSEYRQRLPRDDPFDFDIVLQIHDALLFEVDYAHVPRLIDEVLPRCMCQMIPIYPTDLDGSPQAGRGPYYLGIDTEIAHHWGEQMTPGECLARGIAPKYAGWATVAGGYSHIHEPDVVVAV